MAVAAAALLVVFVFASTSRDSTHEDVVDAEGRPRLGTAFRFDATAYCKGDDDRGRHRGAHRDGRRRSGAAAARQRDPRRAPVERYSGIWTVMDTGPEVKGREIDLYMWSCHDALAFGRRDVRVTILRLGWDPQQSAPAADRAAVPPPRAETSGDTGADAAAADRPDRRRAGAAPPVRAAGLHADRRMPGTHTCVHACDMSRRAVVQLKIAAETPQSLLLLSSPMHALYIVLPALCILAIAYRYYSAFISTRIWMLDDTRQTPAHTKYDGANFYPTTKWVLFGHHFAAITGAGPLVGPMLAAQFGWAPGFIWLVAGVCLAGAVHDAMVLWASTRRGGKSLADLVKIEIGPVAGFAGIFAVLFTLMVALAGLGIAVVNALADSAWGTFTIAMTIPIGMFMGMWMYVWRKGRIVEATVIGVVAMLAAVAGGEPLNHPDSSLGSFFHLSRTQIALALCVYGFVASVLPVWLLLAPRGYLSSFTKIGTILLLAFGVMIVNPELKMPALTEFAGGGGPIIPGTAVPVLLRHHRLRRHLGLPRPDQLGHDLEDDRQGDRHPADRLRRDAGRRRGRHHGARRRHGDAAGRLLRHQRRPRGLRAAHLPGRARCSTTWRRSRRRSARRSKGAPAARSRWRSAWR